MVLILAHRVDPQMLPDLYEPVCKQCGDEHEDCIVPCVVDLTHGTCVFNCLRVPYVGYSYAVKNRGIRIVKNKVFGGKLNLKGSTHFLTPIDGIDPEISLWDLWKDLHHQLVGADRENKRRFESMSEKEIRLVGDVLYLKWDQRGVCQTVKLDAQRKIAQVEPVANWFYPKIQPIGKKTIPKIEEHITSYYAKLGYRVEFTDTEIYHN